eukprot:CAMPEP_0176430510 /NCGR_PEP_ID=MMETSP0127-20121128/14292_1 /TAXON_ID=938130 /ORGANISM="Platyophrya macrostoma, Strain WH" /LENGTH=349 /DNA_ID=CAMNT_0017812405 /DNA_START=39 /DNA_END=1088 /DNA_ORIENTATION=-
MDVEYGYEKQQLLEMAFDPKMVDLALKRSTVKTLEGFIEWIEKNQDVAVEQLEKEASNPNAMTEEKQTANPEGEPISSMVNDEFNGILQSMGYSKFVSEKALFFTQSKSVEAAQEWIDEHKNDPDFEEELRMVKQEEGPKMSKEEAIKAAKELQATLRAKRKAEEEKNERERERNRIESTKALAQAKKEAEEAQYKRDIEELKRQKKKDEEDKKKILEQLQRDKEERFGKKFAGSAPVEKKQTPIEKIDVAIKQMRILYPTHSYPDTMKNCLATIVKVIENCVKNPTEEKFRKINKENAAFKARVGDVVGGLFILESIGFQDKDGFLVCDTVDSALFEEAASKIRPNAV